jgi:ComF family protein
MQLKSIVHTLLHLILPHNCSICSQQMTNTEKHLCIKCLKDLPYTNMASNNNIVSDKLVGRIEINLSHALLFFEKNNMVQKLLHHIKYNYQKQLAIYLGEIWAKSHLNTPQWKCIDTIIPIPLSTKKLYQRGYNQSAYLAKGVANILQLPIAEHILQREKYSKSQTFKTRIERIENIADAFTSKIVPQHVQHVLLIDDVITTGATLEMCAKALLKQNPNIQISVATLAIAH